MREKKEDGSRVKERVSEYWVDRWFSFFYFFIVSQLITTSPRLLSNHSIPFWPHCHCLWPYMMDMLLKHHAKHIIIFLVIIHNLFS